MFAILVYDISQSPDKDKKNYRKICRTVEKYLQRIQFSVFEGEIQPHLLVELRSILKKLVDKERDSVVIYMFKNRAHSERIELGMQKEVRFIK